MVGFTKPEVNADCRNEAETITSFLDSGAVDFFHLRKPEGEITDYRDLIANIPERLHSSIVIDNFPQLFSLGGLGGYHLKSRNIKPDGCAFGHRKPFFTRSFHNLEELKTAGKENKYSFLSPIFDSISKSGYKSKFNIDDENLKLAVENRNIIALGGVKPIDFLKLYGSKFVGAALLGYLWNPKLTIIEKIDSILKEKEKICFNS